MTKKQLLFVDDEENVLHGLRRMLRIMKSEWDMNFAIGANDALGLLKQIEFDVIVSDMRMPGIDGAEFLRQAAVSAPDAIRFVLSGEADIEATIRTIGPSHQFLAKPCKPDDLISRINRLLDYQNEINNDELCRLITQQQMLPTTRQVKILISDAVERKNSNFLSELTAVDPALGLRLLQLSNSCYFDNRANVYHPNQCANLIEKDVLHALFEQERLISADTNKDLGYQLEALANLSLTIAQVCEAIARHMGEDENTQACAYSSGLLHDVSRLILLHKTRDQVSDALIPRLSAYVAALWGLPERIVRPISMQAAQDFDNPSHEQHKGAALYLLTARYLVVPQAVDLQQAALLPTDLLESLPDEVDILINGTRVA